jgi:DNA-binding transcriptional LysR family regulator
MPAVDLRVDTQVMSAVSARVIAGDATLGVVAAPGLSQGLMRTPLGGVQMISVVARDHPFAKEKGPLPLEKLAGAVQIVLSERKEEGLPDQGVLSPRTWRVADLHTKHAMLRAGLGWGNLPDHTARADLASGALVKIQPEGWTVETVPLYAIHRNDTTFGPAHKWLLEGLASRCTKGGVAEAPPPVPKKNHRRSR